MDHHNLDIYPNPRDKSPLYINEPWIIDETADMRITDPDSAADNIRVYVPPDLNKEAILRRLRDIKSKYGGVDWRNETSISVEVALLIHQIEIKIKFTIRGICQSHQHFQAKKCTVRKQPS